MTRSKTTYRNRLYRSLFEVFVAKQLYAAKMKFTYETRTFSFFLPTPNAECQKCGSAEVGQLRTYTPDFFLDNGVVLEAKGILDNATRKRLSAFKKSHPEVDLRLVLQYDNVLQKGAKTRYSQWAKREGFLWCVKILPEEWLWQS